MQNASLEAHLTLGNFRVPLDASYYEWQQVNHRGRPRSKVRAGHWHFATSQLDQATYQQVLVPYTVVDAHAEYARSDGQGVFVTV